MQKLLLVFHHSEIAPQAKSGKYLQIWFFPRFGGKKWRRSEHAHAIYPGLDPGLEDSSFARPGSAPIWGGKKGEFRDWTNSTLKFMRLTCGKSNALYSIGLKEECLFSKAFFFFFSYFCPLDLKANF